MDRKAAFLSLKTDAWYRKYFAKLSQDEMSFCISFIDQNASLDRGAFELKVNRIWIDVANKPKQWPVISELLVVANANGTPAPERSWKHPLS